MPRTPAEPAQRKHWALAVLALLRERDMHPYEMRRLLRERHKDERLMLKPGSLYHTIGWLERNSFVERLGNSREGNRPERTTYRITSAGEDALLGSLRELLGNPVREPASFPVALDHSVHLTPADTAESLEKRALILEASLKAMDHVLDALLTKIGRINLIELEFERAMRQAELTWLRQIIRDLRSGKFTWDIQQILSWLRRAAKVPESKTKPSQKALVRRKARPSPSQNSKTEKST